MGIIEDERFRDGSKAVMKAALENSGYVIVGGGHMVSVLEGRVEDNPKLHISTGGGALLLFLSGEKLPALEALSLSKV